MPEGGEARPEVPRGGRETGVRAFGVLVFVFFLAVSWSSYHAWPFYVFDMYSTADHDRSSRLVAVDAAGRAHEIGAFTAWRCEGLGAAALRERPERCKGTDHVDASDRERLWWLTTSDEPGADAVEVTLVRRTWLFADPTHPHDCPVQRCRAR